MRRRRRRAYLLLETTIATGVLIAGLAVIGAQVQQADTSIREMELQLRALMLAEMKLAELDMGLVELDSVDPIQEEDFGPRFPDYGWRLITEETSIDEVYQLQFEVLYLMGDGEYEADAFDHDEAEILHTLYAVRPLPQKVNMREELGLTEEEADDLAARMEEVGISIDDLDLTLLANLPLDELIEMVVALGPALGIDITRLLGRLPPDLMEMLEGEGLLDEEGTDGEEGEADDTETGGSDEDEDS